MMMVRLVEEPPDRCPHCGSEFLPRRYLVGWDNQLEIPARCWICLACDTIIYRPVEKNG